MPSTVHTSKCSFPTPPLGTCLPELSFLGAFIFCQASSLACFFIPFPASVLLRSFHEKTIVIFGFWSFSAHLDLAFSELLLCTDLDFSLFFFLVQPNRTASSTPARPTFFPRSWRLSLGTGDLDRNRDTPVALHNRSSSRRRRTSTNRYQSQLFWPSGHSAYQLEKRTNIPAAFFASRFAVDGG
jgi:hypothetical protein